MSVCVCMYVWMDGCYVCMYIWSRVPCSRERELGGPYHWGGARDPESGLISVFPHFHTHPITPIQWNSLAQPSSKYLDLCLKHFLVKVSFSVLRRNSKLMAFLGFCWVSVGFLLWHSVLHRSKTMQEAAACGFSKFSGPHFILVRNFDSLIPMQTGSSW